jgi:hypothetical protein
MTSQELGVKEEFNVEAAKMGAVCAVSALDPYAYDFYGDAEAILSHLDDTNLDLANRRKFMLTVQNDGGAEVKMYERIDDRTWSVHSWRGDSADELHTAIADMLFRNKGVFCTGEQAMGVLDKLSIELAPDGVVPAPHSARAAFSHPIRAYTQGGYGRASVTCFC